MLRMLGPHQGIRLERLRSELDDKFEFGENTEPEDIELTKPQLLSEKLSKSCHRLKQNQKPNLHPKIHLQHQLLKTVMSG